MDEQKFEALLQSALLPDTTTVKEATAALRKDFYPNPQSLTTLLHILAKHPDRHMRQLASVQAKTLALQHWDAIPKDAKPQIREGLLKTTLEENNSLVRHSAARIIATIATMDFEENEWTDLPDTLEQASTSSDVAQREVGVYVLFALLELMVNTFAENLSRWLRIFEKTIKDPDSFEVRINTLLALGVIAITLDDDSDEGSVKHFQNMIPSMVAVLKEAVESNDDKRMTDAFKAFTDLLQGEPLVLDPHFSSLVQFMMQLSTTTELSDESRAQAIEFLQQCVATRRLKMQGLKVGEPLTLMAMKIAVELDADKKDIDEDITPGRAALELIDTLAQLLPPPQVIVPLMKALPEYVNSPNADHRRAGILSIGFCAEGAPDFLSTQIKEFTPVMLRLLEDPNPQVRLATIQTITRIADEVGEELESSYEALITGLIKNLDEMQSPTADKKAEEIRNDITACVCSALDTLVLGLDEEDAVRYLPELAPRLSRLFGSEDEKVQLASIAAMGSLASPCEEQFKPVFGDVMSALSPLLTKKESSRELNLRTVVSDAMCSMMTAVGAEATKPYVQPMMTASEEALKLDSPGLRESSYFLWATFSKIYKDDFAHFAPGVMTTLIKSLDQEEMSFDEVADGAIEEVLGPDVSVGKKKAPKLSSALDDDVDLETIDIEDLLVDEDEWDDFSASSAIAEEKAMALESLAEVMTHTVHSTLKFVPQVLEKTYELAEHHFDGIKKAAITTMCRIYAMCWQQSEEKGEMAKWQPGVPLKVQPSNELRQIASKIFPMVITIWTDEMDRDVVSEINQNLAETLKVCGPSIIQNEQTLTSVAAVLKALLEKKHPCQVDPTEDEDEDSDDDDQMTPEYDWLVIDSAMDVLASLAKAFGPAFGAIWKLFQKPMITHAGSSTDNERSTSVGAIAECIQGMGAAVTPYTTALLKIIIHRLSDENYEVRANAAFAAGMICFYSTSDAELKASYPKILNKLEPCLTSDNKTPRLIDNAAGCVSRMIMKHPDWLPLEEVLPALIDILPLSEDYVENEAVWPTIIKLYQVSDPTIRSHSQAVVTAMEKVLSPPEDQLSDDTKAAVVELVKYLHKQQPALIAGKQNLMRAAQS